MDGLASTALVLMEMSFCTYKWQDYSLELTVITVIVLLVANSDWTMFLRGKGL